MKDYIKLNEDKWNYINNDCTGPLTYEGSEETKDNPISVALTVGKKVLIGWFEKANGEKMLGLACGDGQQGLVFVVRGYDAIIMDLSALQLQGGGMVTGREGLKVNTVQTDMTKPFPFVDETFDIISNPVPNVYMEGLENTYQKVSRVLRKSGLLMVGFMNPWIYIYNADVIWDKSDKELLLKLSISFNSKEPEEKSKITINPEYGYKFNHTLETQIRGQLKNGLVMIDFCESCDERYRLSRYGNGYIATLYTKP